MPSTLFLNPATWDLTLDVNNNIAVAPEPYALAQDAASGIKTFLGEVYFDKTIGVPWLQQILGPPPGAPSPPPLALIKQQLVNAAVAANPDIASAQVFISSLNPATRKCQGQVQIVSVTGQTAAASFSVGSPQGGI